VTLPIASSGSIDWYLTRSTGAVTLILLTITLALGVADVTRFSSARWPRFVIDSLHRNVSLLAVLFLAIHVLTSILDGFAQIQPIDAVIPFVGSYRPLWLGLGAVALDLMLAVVLTSMLRRRMGYATWRTTHWLAYACWPIALLHGLGTGSDVQSSWLLYLSLGCLALVLTAVLARLASGWPADLGVRAGAAGAAAAFSFGLALWLPAGPLGEHWARRSGTPAALLGGHGAKRPVSR